jgi:hypothetical protein
MTIFFMPLSFTPLGRGPRTFVTGIVACPTTVSALSPQVHLGLLLFAIPFLEHAAEGSQISFDIEKILIRDLLPFRFEGSFQLGPKLAELFLIHDDSLE